MSSAPVRDVARREFPFVLGLQRCYRVALDCSHPDRYEMERKPKPSPVKPRTLALCFGWVLLSAATLLPAAPADPNQEDAMQKAHRQAVQRRRRIMYNDDGCHPRPYTTPEELVSLRMRQLIGTQVDTICYCTGGGGLFWGHVPQVGELIGKFVVDSDAQYVKDICTSVRALQAMGTDPLAVAVDFAHKQGMEAFWSYRMNNVEDSFVGWGHPQWKRDRPQYCFGKPEDWNTFAYTDPRKWWAALNFEHPEVRAYILQIFGDVCGRYDIDGVDLDFFRHPRFFPPTTHGLPVTAEHAAMMTDLVRGIRAMTTRVARERGRPLLISCRVPLSVERCLAIGLDVETWLREGLVDIYTFGGDLGPMAMAPQLRTMVALAHRGGARAYANIGGSGMQKNQGYTSEEAWWAAATNAWQAGADGIYTFNLFPRVPDVRLSRIGSPDTLKGADKLYAIDPIKPKNLWGFNRSALVIPGRLPITLGPSGKARALLPVGEDVAANAPLGKAATLRLRVRLAGVVKGDALVICVNQHPPAVAAPAVHLSAAAATAWFELAVAPEQLLTGDNSIDLQVATTRPVGPETVVDRLELTVTYR